MFSFSLFFFSVIYCHTHTAPQGRLKNMRSCVESARSQRNDGGKVDDDDDDEKKSAI